MYKDTLIIYHAVKSNLACPDGAAGAWVAKKAFPESDLLGCCYKEDSPPITDMGYKNVIITDFSFASAILKSWEAVGISVTALDHHKTAQENLFSARLVMQTLQVKSLNEQTKLCK